MEQSSTKTPGDTVCHRKYFYVGGQYEDDGKGGHMFTGQMYVEHLTPLDQTSNRPWPIIMIHGGGQTGTNFLNTPDNRPGWASWLLASGYTVYIIDQPSRGRSAHTNHKTTHFPAELAERRWTATAEFALWPEARLHTQWPGSGRMGDPIFDAYYASTVPTLADHSLEQRLMRDAGAALLDRIGPAILIAHSQGGTHGLVLADARPQSVKALIAVEPSGPPFGSTIAKDGVGKAWGVADTPLAYDPEPDPTDGGSPLLREIHKTADGKTFTLQQEPARTLKNLASVAILVVTGEASSHAGYDDFTVEFLRQAGVAVTHMRLEEEGIRGNGHLMFLEKNNLEIVERLERYFGTIE